MLQLERLQMAIVTEIGEVKTRTYIDVVDEEDDYDFFDSLRDFVYLHIGHSYIFDDFSPTTLYYRAYSEKVYTEQFNTLNDMREWYLWFFL